MIELIKEIYEAINHFFDGLKKAINRVHSGIVTGEIKASEIAKVNIQIEPFKGVDRRSAFKNVNGVGKYV
ncbi:hypothetical protein DUK53_16065 [Listeria sp. SHR_NRA_18]|uniref:hypothetical protein n=1 Tax=Listeria sp. SHR_NRA_18 TaxID=2269046 RepID=UPI000F5D5DAA|nr:hypothetical protein [Listeria sp. SHR_NRA_18]RQW65466.1 hypothetical protein DUK53_16065 [Listeria sp. SHR_NRA_18]